jgi:hypothetical protein
MNQIKNIPNQIGMPNVWLQPDNFDINVCVIKLRIVDIYKQIWYSNINKSNRLSSKSHFKQEFQCENYISVTIGLL